MVPRAATHDQQHWKVNPATMHGRNTPSHHLRNVAESDHALAFEKCLRGRALRRKQRELFAFPIIAISIFSVPETFVHMKADARSLKFMSLVPLTVCRFSWEERYVRSSTIFHGMPVSSTLKIFANKIFLHTLHGSSPYPPRRARDSRYQPHRADACWRVRCAQRKLFAHFSLAWNLSGLFLSAVEVEAEASRVSSRSGRRT